MEMNASGGNRRARILVKRSSLLTGKSYANSMIREIRIGSSPEERENVTKGKLTEKCTREKILFLVKGKDF